MKRVLKYLVERLYKIEARRQLTDHVQRLIGKANEAFTRYDTTYRVVITQDVMGEVLRRLPMPASVLHYDWGDMPLESHVIMDSAVNRVERDFGMKVVAYRTAVEPTTGSFQDTNVFNGYVYSIRVRIYDADLMHNHGYGELGFVLRKRVMAGLIEGDVPFWRLTDMNVDIVHPELANIVEGAIHGFMKAFTDGK